MTVNTAAVGNWITENCSTTDAGDLILTGAADQTRITFGDILPAGGTVWYSISDGLNREAGIGTFIPPNTIQRTTVTVTKIGTVYDNTTPSPISLSGGAYVSSTLNAAAFTEIVTELNSHILDTSIHFTEASIDHLNILNTGSFTHAQLDAHAVDGTIHYLQSAISITESQISDLQPYLLNITAESIKDLSDVLTTMTPVDGQVLTFDTTNGWQAEIPQEVAGNKVRELITQAVHGFVSGDALYFNGNIWVKAQADLPATIATVICELIDAGSFYAVSIGDVTGLTGLVSGDWYYVSTSTPGVITNVVPTIGISNPMGYAQSTTILHVLQVRANDVGSIPVGGGVSHTDLSDIGVNTHAQIDSHITTANAHFGDATIHFAEASIAHANIIGVGTNTHAQIDTHIADGTIHFTEASIAHANIVGVGVNSHATIDSHIADGTLHFTEGSIAHANIVGVGVNTHASIDSHITTANAHIADGTLHFTEASIDHTAILNIGTNTHAQIDTHIADGTIHGYQPLAINTQAGTTYTAALSDAGNYIKFTNAAAITLTLAPNSTVAYADGTEIFISQEAAGQVTVAPGGGVTLHSPGGFTKLNIQYSAASLIYKGSNNWLLVGDFV